MLLGQFVDAHLFARPVHQDAVDFHLQVLGNAQSEQVLPPVHQPIHQHLGRQSPVPEQRNATSRRRRH